MDDKEQFIIIDEQLCNTDICIMSRFMNYLDLTEDERKGSIIEECIAYLYPEWKLILKHFPFLGNKYYRRFLNINTYNPVHVYKIVKFKEEYGRYYNIFRNSLYSLVRNTFFNFNNPIKGGPIYISRDQLVKCFEEGVKRYSSYNSIRGRGFNIFQFIYSLELYNINLLQGDSITFYINDKDEINRL